MLRRLPLSLPHHHRRALASEAAAATKSKSKSAAAASTEAASKSKSPKKTAIKSLPSLSTDQVAPVTSSTQSPIRAAPAPLTRHQRLAPKTVSLLDPYAALELVRHPKLKRAFGESVEVAYALHLDTKKENQQLRVVADLPHGTGKVSRLAVFTNDPEKQALAKAAGAETAGGAELIASIAGGAAPDFEQSLATVDMVPLLGKVAKILGPRGLMPSKKLGTVVESGDELVKAVRRAKAGAVELRADRLGVVRAGIGKISMPLQTLVDNLKAVVLTIENNKPSGAKGKKIFKSLYVKSSMGHTVGIADWSVDPKNQRFFAAATVAAEPTTVVAAAATTTTTATAAVPA